MGPASVSLLLPRRVEKGTLGPKIRFEVLPVGKGLTLPRRAEKIRQGPPGEYSGENTQGEPPRRWLSITDAGKIFIE